MYNFNRFILLANDTCDKTLPSEDMRLTCGHMNFNRSRCITYALMDYVVDFQVIKKAAVKYSNDWK